MISMRLPPEFIAELKARNDIESLIGQYIVLKRAGSNLVGLCPFHNEKTPSFTIWPEKGSFYCFGCGVGGDAVSFIMQIEHLDYIEAVKMLADRCGMQMPESGVDDRTAKLKARIYEANREAARFFHDRLVAPEGKAARDYLTGRGLAPKTINQFGLGYAPDGWSEMTDHLHTLGFGNDILDQAGLVSKTQKGSFIDRFRNRVMFPVIDIRGNVIAFSGRKLNEDDFGGKYVNTSDTPVYRKGANIFGMNFAKNHADKRIILVEGNMDVVSLHQAGFNMAVAALGTAFTADQARLLARYTPEVVVTMDADGAGAKATDKVLRILSEAGVKARVLRLPECKDPDEFIKKNGASRFEALLDGAVTDIEYKLHLAGRDLDIMSSDGKLEYLRKTTAVLAEEKDMLARELYAAKISEICGVSKKTILEEIKNVEERNKKHTVRKELSAIVSPLPTKNDVNPQKRQFPRAAAAEEAVNSVLIKHPDFYDKIKETLTAEDFVTDFSRRVFEAICEVLDNNNVFDLSMIASEFSPSELGYVSMLENTAITGEHPEKVLDAGIAILRKEKKRISAGNDGDMSVDEWARMLKNIAEDKKG